MFAQVFKDSAASTKAWASRNQSKKDFAKANLQQLAGLAGADTHAQGKKDFAKANLQQLAGLAGADSHAQNKKNFAKANLQQLAGLAGSDKAKATAANAKAMGGKPKAGPFAKKLSSKTEVNYLGSVAATLGLV